MIVDDHQEIANLMKIALQTDAFNTHEFTNPLLALDYLKQFLKFAFAITDIRILYEWNRTLSIH